MESIPEVHGEQGEIEDNLDKLIVGGVKPETKKYRVLVRREGDDDVFELGIVYFDNKDNPSQYSDRVVITSSSPTQLAEDMINAINEACRNDIYWGDARFPQVY